MRVRTFPPPVLLLAAALLVCGTTVASEEEATDPVPGTSVKRPEKEKQSTTSLSQSLQADSGVSVQTMCTNCNNADLSLGGLGNEHVSVVCDGMPVPSGLAQIYLFSVMPATMIDKVAVNKGASDAGLSGSSVGGGIAIERRTPKDLVVNASADAGSYGWRGLRADLSGETGWFGGSLVGSYSQSDVIDANGDNNPNLPEFDRYTVEAGMWFQMGDRNKLKIGAQRYKEEQLDGPAAYDFFTSTPDTVVYNLENVALERTQYDLQYDSDLGEAATLVVNGAWSERNQDIEETEQRKGDFLPTYSIGDNQGYASVGFVVPRGERNKFRFGTSVRRQDLSVVDVNFNRIQFPPVADPLTESFDERITEAGAFLEWEGALGNRVQLSLGMRYVSFNYSDTESRSTWLRYSLPEGDRGIPRFALLWKPVDPLQLRFSAGGGYRAPDPIYDKVCCGRQYRNNRGIRVESSRSFGIEATYQPGPKYKIGASAFLTDFEDLAITMATLSFQYRPTYQNVNVPSARNTSFAIDGNFTPATWVTLKASASWLDADNQTAGDAVPALIDNFNNPTWKVFQYSTIPYLYESQGVLAVVFRPERLSSINLSGQFSGPMQIQWFDQFNPDWNLGGSELQDTLVETDEFWTVNVRYSRSFRQGVTVNLGVDNLTDYVQSDLGDPMFDYKWGPLRGRYAYVGLGYSFDRKR